MFCFSVRKKSTCDVSMRDTRQLVLFPCVTHVNCMALAPLRIIPFLSCDCCKHLVGDALARLGFGDSDRYVRESVHLSEVCHCHVQMPLNHSLFERSFVSSSTHYLVSPSIFLFFRYIEGCAAALKASSGPSRTECCHHRFCPPQILGINRRYHRRAYYYYPSVLSFLTYV